MDNKAEYLSTHGRALLNRREFLRQSGMTMGAIGLAHLLAQDKLLAADEITVGGKTPIRPKIDPDNPYLPSGAHYHAEAQQILIIYCPGAVSHLDTFDYKPELERFHGQKPPGVPAVTFEGPSGNIAKPFWEFRPSGKSGKMVSDLLPHMGGLVDDVSFVHSLHTQTSAHPQGRIFSIRDLPWRVFRPSAAG